MRWTPSNRWFGLLQYVQGIVVGLLLGYNLTFLKPETALWVLIGGVSVLIGLGLSPLLARAFGLIPSEQFEPAYLPPDPKRIQQELRNLLHTGWCLEAAIHFLHYEQRYEYSFLWPAVVLVSGLSQEEAIQLVATSCKDQTKAVGSDQIQVTTSVKR
jgi:hypothetical protein